MGSGNRGGFVVEKEEATERDFGLGLKMMVMMGNQHNHGHDDESGGSVGGFSGDRDASAAGGYPGGATGVAGFGNFGAVQESTNTTSGSTVYDLVGAAPAASGVASSVQGSSPAFDPSSFKSWGGGVFMGLGGGTQTRAFTASQRQELERQTIIYKYIAASMPIPPELLIPINSKYFSQFSLHSSQSNDHGGVGGKNALDLKYAAGNRDPEPWRCRRTDGKKWRCSRDVAPEQKYCERHSHKGRPSRSRKHVESSTSSSSSSSSISNARINNTTLVSSSTSSTINPANVSIKPSFLYQTSPAMFLPQHHHNPPQYSHSRFPEWFMKRGAQAHHDQFQQPELHQMVPTHPHSTRASSEFMGNNPSHPPLPRQFLDAWSIGEKTDGIGEITGKPASSNSSLLTLSMAGGGCNEENDEAAQLGMGLFESERERDVSGSSGGGERYAWMGSSAPGGPLAEALCLGIVGADGSGSGACGSTGSNGQGESGQGLGFMK